MLSSGIAVPQFKAPRGSPDWRTNVPPTGIVVGVVVIQDKVPHARLCRAAEKMDARDTLPVGVLHTLIVMRDNMCRCTGHVAANSNVLTIALFIKEYKRDLSDDVKDKIETD